MSQLSAWLLEDVPNHHWVQIHYQFPRFAADITPVALAGIEYRIVSLQDENIVFSGQLDAFGQARHEGFVPGPVAVYLGSDATTSRMAADKLRESLKQSLDSLAVLLTAQAQQIERECERLNPRPSLSPAIVPLVFESSVPQVLRLLASHRSLTEEQTKFAYLLLSDADLMSAIEQFIAGVQVALMDCLFARTFVLDLVNALLIDVLLGEGGILADDGQSPLAHCKKILSPAALLLDEMDQQLRELIPLFYQCKLSTHSQRRTNTEITIEWREPPSSQRCENHHANIALMPVNYQGDAVALGSENCIDDSCVHGVTGELVLAYEDFVLNGPVPLVWQRHYRSSNPQGWSSLAQEALRVENKWVNYYRADGVVVGFELPPMGKYSTNITLGLTLQRLFYSVFVISAADGIERVFSGIYAVTLPTGSQIQHCLEIVEEIPLTQIKNAYSECWDFIYRHRQLVAVKSSWGHHISIEWNEGGVMSRVINNNDATVLADYQWSPEGLISVVTATKDCWQYTYLAADADGTVSNSGTLISLLRSPAGIETQIQWLCDGQRWRVKETNTPRVGRCLFHYVIDEQRVICLPDSATQKQLHWQYDTRGLVLMKASVVTPDEEGGENIQTQGGGATDIFNKERTQCSKYRYDKNGQLISYTDTEGNVTQYRYNPEGLLTATIDPAGGGFSMAYDEKGRLQEYTNALGESWSCEYNKQGMLETVADPFGVAYRLNCVAGLPVSMSVDNIDVEKKTDASGGSLAQTWQRYWQWDAYANLVMDSASGRLNQATYNAAGQLIQLADRGQEVLALVYDQKNQLQKITTGGSVQLLMSYHGSGRVEQIANAGGQQIDLDFDDCGRFIRWQEGRGRALSLSYNAQGQIQQIATRGSKDTCVVLQYGLDGLPKAFTDAKGVEFSLGFDGRGMVIQCDEKITLEQNKTGSVGRTMTWQYDACGRQIYRADAAGCTKTQYDVLGRGVEHLAGDETVQCTYRPGGQLVQYSSSSEHIEHGYNALGFRTSTVFSKGYVVEYRYCAPGVLSEVVVNDNKVIEIFRDSGGMELYRKQGGYEYRNHDESVASVVNEAFGKMLEQACLQLDSGPQSGPLAVLLLMLQLEALDFPPLLKGQLKNLEHEGNPLRGISNMPEPYQMDDGVVVCDPVIGRPLLCIYQNQVYFYHPDSAISASPTPAASGWFDWHGNSASPMVITGKQQKVPNKGLGNLVISKSQQQCTLSNFIEPTVINSLSLAGVFSRY